MDNGSEFIAETTRKTLKAMGIDQKLVSVYHPASNGQVERFNRQAKNILRCIMQEKDTKDWPKLVPYINFIINTSPQTTLANLTPFQLFYARSARLNLPGYTRKVLETPIEFLKRIQSYMKRAMEMAHDSKLKMMEKNKQAHDAHSKIREFKIGQKVMMTKTNRTTLDEVYQGPYEVRELRCGQNVGIWRNNKIQFVHKDLLKLYQEEDEQNEDQMENK
jgi:hypothetical protein